MKWIPLGACLAYVVFGCGGRASGVRPDANAARDAENASSAVANVNPDVHIGASTDAGDVYASCAWTNQPSAWIGETDTTVTVPDGDYDGGDPLVGGCALCGLDLGLSSTVPDSKHEKVVLILNPISDSVTGTITFGEDRPPPPPTEAKAPYPPPTHYESTNGAIYGFSPMWQWGPPYPGFSYSLISSSESVNVLHLAFESSEIWRNWCALQDPKVGPPFGLGYPLASCVCDGGECRAETGQIDRIDVAFDCKTMQGELLWEAHHNMLSSGPVTIRLQRVP